MMCGLFATEHPFSLDGDSAHHPSELPDHSEAHRLFLSHVGHVCVPKQKEEAAETI